MQYTSFGRTGLRVSVAGLGCGGFSRLGLGSGKSEAEAADIVRAALDRGVNLIDTAAVYGTERAVGLALKGRPRSEAVVATKARPGADAKGAVASLDNSLRELGLDYVDIFQLHAVTPRTYDQALNEVAPALLRERAKGKFRHLGISESSPFDHGHAMLVRALDDAVWESAMLAFHMMHQNARMTVFPKTQANGVGTLLMFVVRNIFARPEPLRQAVAALVAEGKLPAELAARDNALDFLIHEAGAANLTDAAYRYARHEPGADVVLFGTGDRAHLDANIASILRPPLPEGDRARLAELCGHLVGVGLELPPASTRAPR